MTNEKIIYLLCMCISFVCFLTFACLLYRLEQKENMEDQRINKSIRESQEAIIKAQRSIIDQNFKILEEAGFKIK